jgi:hypothetical protein
MSIKGTVGGTELIGRSAVYGVTEALEPESCSLATSENYMAFRHRGNTVPPEYLMLYFRSKQLQHPSEALLVGTNIPHVTPDALCTSVRVPIP